MNKGHAFLSEDRIAALIFMVGTMAYWIGVTSLGSLRSDDVVGPAGFPKLIALAAFALGGWLFIRPPADGEGSPLSGAVWLYWLVFLAYVASFPVVGFGLGTAIFLTTTFVVLKVPVMRAGITALVITGTLWLLFAWLLKVRLPLGPWG